MGEQTVDILDALEREAALHDALVEVLFGALPICVAERVEGELVFLRASQRVEQVLGGALEGRLVADFIPPELKARHAEGVAKGASADYFDTWHSFDVMVHGERRAIRLRPHSPIDADGLRLFYVAEIEAR